MRLVDSDFLGERAWVLSMLLPRRNASSAHTGPPAGPIQAKKADNACTGPESGPIRALSSLARSFEPQLLTDHSCGLEVSTLLGVKIGRIIM